jgi:hypothetical protein
MLENFSVLTSGYLISREILGTLWLSRNPELPMIDVLARVVTTEQVRTPVIHFPMSRFRDVLQWLWTNDLERRLALIQVHPVRKDAFHAPSASVLSWQARWACDGKTV